MKAGQISESEKAAFQRKIIFGSLISSHYFLNALNKPPQALQQGVRQPSMMIVLNFLVMAHWISMARMLGVMFHMWQKAMQAK